MFDIRRRETLRILETLLRRGGIKSIKYLDLGCGNGSFTLRIAKVLNAREVYGVDISTKLVEEARDKGINAYVVDLNTDDLPFNDEEFEVVSAFDVIEFLWNTDKVIGEVYRVLKPKGYFILTTPNLASWINRLLLLFSYLPMYYEISQKFILERRPFQSLGARGCMRLYTFPVLKDI